MTRRLVVDGQLFQTLARHRGMGRYSRSLLAELSGRGIDVEVLVSADREVPDLELPGVRVTSLDLRQTRSSDLGVLHHNRSVVAAHLAPGTDLVVLSALQADLRPAVPRADGVRTYALVYDLIPLIRRATYLRWPDERAGYAARLAELTRADGVLTISRSAAADIGRELGIDPERVHCIDGAPVDSAPADGATGLRSPARTRPWVLMPTGHDPRKNNRRGVLAFGRFNAAHDHAYDLVVTSTFRPDEQSALASLAPHVTFTGTVPAGELAGLYAGAAAVLFPATDEGLGLPVLEALEAGTPVACSDIAVLREVSAGAARLFDPLSVPSMARALDAAVAEDTVPRAVAEVLAARYAWPRVADLVLAALDRPVDRIGGPAAEIRSPAPGTAVGDLVQQAAAEVGRRLRPSYVLESVRTDRPDWLRWCDGTTVVGAEPGLRRASGRAGRDAVHHLADDPGAARTLLTALAGGAGVLVLHDTSLDRAWRELVVGGLVDPSRAALAERIGRAVGLPGAGHLGPLLRGHRVAVVLDAPAEAAVVAVAGAVGSAIAVVRLPRPVAAVPYADPRRPRSRRLLTSAELRRLDPVARADAVADAAFAEMAPGVGTRAVLEVLRFGTIPVLDVVPDDVPKGVCVSAAEVAGVDEAARAARATRAVDAVRTTHSYAAFARALAQVVAGATTPEFGGPRG